MQKSVTKTIFDTIMTFRKKESFMNHMNG